MLLDTLQASGVPFLPGTATPSDIVALLERGITHAKLFPAEVVGRDHGAEGLRGPVPSDALLPDRRDQRDNAPDYLAQPNVVCVGGSWMTSGDVEAQARAAAEVDSVAGETARA